MARGSHVTWGGWEPRLCYVCGERVTLKQSGGSSYGDPAAPSPRTWHAACASGRRKATA